MGEVETTPHNQAAPRAASISMCGPPAVGVFVSLAPHSLMHMCNLCALRDWGHPLCGDTATSRAARALSFRPSLSSGAPLLPARAPSLPPTLP